MKAKHKFSDMERGNTKYIQELILRLTNTGPV